MTAHATDSEVLALAAAAGAKVCLIRPGKFRFVVPVSLVDRSFIGLFSFAMMSILAVPINWALSFLLSEITAGPLAALATVLLWAFVNLRGISLTVDITNAKYSQFGITEITTPRPLPPYQLVLKGDKTSMLVGSSTIASGGDAEALRSLARALGLSEAEKLQFNAGHELDKIKSQTAESDDFVIPVGREKETNKVVLIHGTFGHKSSWAYPDPERSLIAKSLLEHEAFDGEIKRFGWTGCNSSKDRDQAARSLSQQLQNDLLIHNRQIILIGHSHGGNIAVDAVQHLPAALRKNVSVCALGTPFLDWNVRFRISDLIQEMPEFLASNLSAVSFLGFWASCLIAYFFVQDAFVPFEHQVSLAGGSTSLIGLGIIFALMFGPFWVFGQLAKRFRAMLNKGDDTFDRENAKQNYAKRMLVINFDHDEALQALGGIIGLFSLVQIGLFFTTHCALKLINRAKIVDIVGGGVFTVVWLALVSSAAVGGLAYLSSLAGIVTNQATSLINALENIGEVAVTALVIVLVGFGILFISIVMLFWVFGALRAAIFWAAGVLDHELVKRDFLEVIFGSVSVTSVPHGASEVFVFHGSRMSNHTKIYDEAQPVEKIVDFVLDVDGYKA